MKQDAIIFTRINAAKIAAELEDFNTEEMLLEEYKWMLKDHHILVLTRDILADGTPLLSYVVTRQMFETNNPGIELTTEHFTFVRHV